MRVAIIADDLTGANDSGVQLAKCGLHTSVLLRMSTESAAGQDAIVLNTDCRSASRENAYRRVKRAAEFVQSQQADIVFNKIDSTLRGNFGAGIDALYDSFQPELVIIAPAYPRNGRTIQNGWHYLRGRLLSETEVAADPKTPVTESFVPKLLSQQTSRQIELIGTEQLRAGADEVAAELQQLRERGVPYAVFDSSTEDEMRVIVDAVQRSGLRVIWTGSAGLAQAMSSLWTHSCAAVAAEAAKQSADRTASETGQPSGGLAYEAGRAAGNLAGEQNRRGTLSPVLIVMGSVSGASRTQLELLLQEPHIHGVAVQSELLVQGRATRELEIARVCELAEQVLSFKKHLALYSTAGSSDIARVKQVGEVRGLSAGQIGDLIAAALGEAAVKLIERFKLRGIVMTGGDTAGQICDRLGVERFDLLDEVETGVPIGTLVGGVVRRLAAITKAGGFGTDRVLIKAVHKLEEDCSL